MMTNLNSKHHLPHNASMNQDTHVHPQKTLPPRERHIHGEYIICFKTETTHLFTVSLYHDCGKSTVITVTA